MGVHLINSDREHTSWLWLCFALYACASFATAVTHGVRPDWLLLLLLFLLNWGGLLVMVSVSILSLIRRRSARMLLVVVGVLVLSLAVHIGTWQLNELLLRQRAGFYLFYPSYQSVVNKILEGELRADATGQVHLGAHGTLLSDDGRLSVSHKVNSTTIIFYNIRGILGEFDGYVYRSDGSPYEGCFYSEALMPVPS